MRFEINKNLLIDTLDKVNKIINTKNINIAFCNLYLVVKINEIVFTGVNNEYSLKSVIKNSENLKINSTGCLLINSKQILEIIKKMDGENINISAEDNNNVLIMDDRSEYNINVLDPEIFPEYIFIEKGNWIVVSCNELRKAMNQTIVSVNEYSTNKIAISGLNFNYNNNTLKIYGTDNNRISRREIECLSNNCDELSGTIPYKTILETIKIIPEKGECKIIRSKNSISFKFDQSLFQTILLEGTYPEIEKFIPKIFDVDIKLSYKKFYNLISRSDLSQDINNKTTISFEIVNNKIFVKSHVQNIGDFSEEFTDFIINKECRHLIRINAKFLLDALKTFNVKEINLKIQNQTSPIYVSSDEYKDLIHIILPMLPKD